MNASEIKNAVLNPEMIRHLYGLKIDNQWGVVNGRQFLIEVARLCDKHEELLKSQEAVNEQKNME